MKCHVPYNNIEIHQNGDVYTCCPAWNNYYKIGNIFEHSIEEIWNGKEIIALREKIIHGDYSLCNKDTCFIYKNKEFYLIDKYKIDTICKAYPKYITLGYDYECNIACKICRAHVELLSDEDIEKLNDKIESFFLPMLKECKILKINAAGDPFASRHSKLLLKKAIQNYPDLKLDIITNGILCNEKIFNEIGLTPEKIINFSVSLHASNKKTYGKMVKNGEKFFDIIINNIKWLSEISKNKFPLYLNFVVTAENYRDLPSFVKLAKKYNTNMYIWEYRRQQNHSENPRHEELDITDKNHKEYKNLIKILNEPLLIANKKSFCSILLDIQKEYNQLPLSDKIKLKWKNLIYKFNKNV